MIFLENTECRLTGRKSFNALHKKWSFRKRISSVNVTKSARNFLVTFTEEILNGKLDLLCSDGCELGIKTISYSLRCWWILILRNGKLCLVTAALRLLKENWQKTKHFLVLEWECQAECKKQETKTKVFSSLHKNEVFN